MNNFPDPKWRFFKKTSLFPLFHNSPLTANIFSYLDVKKKAKILMSSLNSFGYLLSLKSNYDNLFVLYLKSDVVCRGDLMFDHQKDLSIYKSVKVIKIDIFSDGNYPRGISITYLLDGYKSEVKTYLTKISPDEEIIKTTLNIKASDTIKSVQITRTKIITFIKITDSAGNYIEVGDNSHGDQFIGEIPDGFQAHSFVGCITNGYPFPAIVGINLNMKHQETGAVKFVQPKQLSITVKNMDLHDHFDLVSKHAQNFVRIKSMIFYTQSEKISLAQLSKNNLDYPPEYQTINPRDLMNLKNKLNETFIDIEVIKGFKFTFVKNVKEDKKLCPFEARENPNWRCKEWYEDDEDEQIFYGVKNKSKLAQFKIDLGENEYITKVTGIMNTYISRLDLTTNFGKKYSVGHNYPDFLKDIGQKELPRNMIPKPRQFQMNVPKGSRVVGLSGAFNENLITLDAHYE
ncbi:UNKNOWN [Stylonychia lemnae]|uniref:Jacalin-type lectin domain-containing protein n=1 Tax=Stylonychia lemnae TaxID=5949 RepID=A0A078AUD7_STYLE|nr:UNKNOWN [Stylonychia lemnae]|eukprot:CDW84468.1 UNKNOWN [Stylonychia lemnae]